LASDGSEMWQASDWPALRYLETVSNDDSSVLAPELASLILSITDAARNRHIDNWRVWWSLATILSTLPIELVQLTHINCVAHWMSSKFNSSMAGSVLAEKLLPRLLQGANAAHAAIALALVDVLTTIKARGADHA